jgi:hypothetical protein
MQTTTITIRLPAAEKVRAQRLAGSKNLSAWARRLILRELQPATTAGWSEHFADLQQNGLRVEGHPEDEIVRRRR